VIKIGVSEKLTKEVMGMSILVIFIVVLSIVLLKFKTENISNSICPGTGNSTHLYYNATSDACCLGTSSAATSCAGSNTTAISQIGANINTTVGAIDEPVTWIAIIVIIVVLGWLVYYLRKTKK